MPVKLRYWYTWVQIDSIILIIELWKHREIGREVKISKLSLLCFDQSCQLLNCSFWPQTQNFNWGFLSALKNYRVYSMAKPRSVDNLIGFVTHSIQKFWQVCIRADLPYDTLLLSAVVFSHLTHFLHKVTRRLPNILFEWRIRKKWTWLHNELTFTF